MENEILIQRICRHEVGHLIAAREIGFITHEIKVSIALGSGHRALSVIELWTPHIIDIPSVIKYLNKRLIVLYAGAVAESLDQHGNYDGEYALNEWRNGGAMDDYAKIRELTQLLRNLIYPETTDREKIDGQLKDIGDEVCRKTGELLLGRKELIWELSSMLIKKFREYGKEFDLTELEMMNVQAFKEAYF